jgi:predicted DsbA family dithiol-disulfide isomerase
MFPLHPETPAEGLSLVELFRSTPEKVAAMVAGLRRTAETMGLPFGARTDTYNSRLAQELGIWADDQGRGDQFHHAAFRAYFGDGRNLAREEVLLNLARKAGLSASNAETILAERTYRHRVDQDWNLARELAITAVPTFLAGKRRLVGAAGYNDLVRLVNP